MMVSIGTEMSSLEGWRNWDDKKSIQNKNLWMDWHDNWEEPQKAKNYYLPTRRNWPPRSKRFMAATASLAD